MKNKVFVSCAVTGSGDTAKKHPDLPITPDQIAKAAIESACRQLSIELAPFNVAVNAIQAGVTDTAALRKIPGNDMMVKNAMATNPHQRLTEPEDIADVIEMFLFYNSSWMTGNIIRIDGGEDITN